MAFNRDKLKSELLPQNVQNGTYAYKLKDISNNFNDILKDMLANSLVFNRDIISSSTNWDNIEPDTVTLVTNWSGNNAPKMHTQLAGVVFTFYIDMSGVNYTGQVVIVPNEIAIRIENVSDWTYTSEDTSRFTNAVNKIQQETDQANSSLAAHISENAANVISLARKTGNDISDVKQQISNDNSSMSSSASSLSSALIGADRSIRSNSGSINKLSDNVSTSTKSFNSEITTNSNSITSLSESANTNINTNTHNISSLSNSTDTKMNSTTNDINSLSTSANDNRINTINNINSLSNSAKNSINANSNQINANTQSLATNISNTNNVLGNTNNNISSLSTSTNGNFKTNTNSINSLAVSAANAINDRPGWNDENWTRNNVAPSLANSALANANNHTDASVNNLQDQITNNYNKDLAPKQVLTSGDMNGFTTTGTYNMVGDFNNAPVPNNHHFWAYLTVLNYQTTVPGSGQSASPFQFIIINVDDTNSSYNGTAFYRSGAGYQINGPWIKLSTNKDIANLQNQINSKPGWNDENWTRNNVVPNAENNAVGQANNFTNQQINNNVLLAKPNAITSGSPTNCVNTMLTRGVYPIHGGGSKQGLPGDNIWGSLIVNNYDPYSYSFQIVTNVLNNGVWFRTSNTGDRQFNNVSWNDLTDNGGLQNQVNQLRNAVQNNSNNIANITNSYPSKMHVYDGGTVDLNALSEQGVYSFSGTTLNNAPDNAGGQFTGYMKIVSSTGNPADYTPDRIQVLVLDFNTQGNALIIWLRHWSGGHWFNWEKLADSYEFSGLQGQMNNIQKMFNQNGNFVPMSQNLTSVVNQPTLGTWIVSTISAKPGATYWISYLQGGSLIINNSASVPNLTLVKHVGDERVYRYVAQGHSFTIGWNGSDAGGTCAQDICVTQSDQYIPFDFTSNSVTGQTNYLLNLINNSNVLPKSGTIPDTNLNNDTTDGIYNIQGQSLTNSPGDARDAGNYYGTLKVFHDAWGQIWQILYTDWGNPSDQNSTGQDGDGAIAYRCMNQGWNVIVTQSQTNDLQNQINNANNRINNTNSQLHFTREIGPESGDFNNFTQTGYYAIWDGGTQNSPIQHNGSLLVFDQPNTETLLQVFFDGSDNRAWIRQRGLLGDNTDWNAWKEIGSNAIQPIPSWVSDLGSIPDGRWYLPDTDIGDYDTIMSQQTYQNNQVKVQTILYCSDGDEITRSFTNGKWNSWQPV